MRTIYITLLTVLMSLFSTILFAQSPYGQGDHNPPNDKDHPYIPGPGTTTSGGISADPNEIIGPAGFW